MAKIPGAGGGPKPKPKLTPAQRLKNELLRRRRPKPKPVVRPRPRRPAPRIPGAPTSLTTVRTMPQLGAVAGAQVEEEIRGEALPYELGLEQTARDRARDLLDLNQSWGALQPFVSESAQRYGQYTQGALEAQRGIFNEASGKLDQLQQQRAAEAQQLAQQIGGPVPIEEFTGPVAETQGDFAQQKAGGLLHALAGSQANLGQVEQFAGQVFPMVRMEELGKTIRHFEDREAELNRQIESIKSSAGKRKTTRLNELVGAEREYELGKTQQRLERLKADRDWTIARRQQAQDKVRTDLEWANLMGYKESRRKVGKKGKKRWVTTRTPTLAGRQLGEEIRAARAQEGLTAAQIETANYTAQSNAAEAAATLSQAERFNAQKMNEGLREEAANYMDALETPGKPVTVTRYDQIPEGEEGLYDPNTLIPREVGGKTVYFKASKESIQAPRLDTRNPTAVFKYLTGRGIPRGMAITLIRQRYNIPASWTPEKQAAYVLRKRKAKAKREREWGQGIGRPTRIQ